MADIPGGQRRSAGERNPCDLGVAHVDRPTGSLTTCGQGGRLRSGVTVEGEHPLLEILPV